MPISPSFLDNGFDIVKASDMAPLDAFRDSMFEKAKELLGDDSSDPTVFFDCFHERGLSGSALNDFRLGMIDYATNSLDLGMAVYQAFRTTLLELVGPDIVVQRTSNLVIQQPGDIDVAPVHRDSPINSPFEIVVWVPLVDCFGTKGMMVADKSVTLKALDALSDTPNETTYAEYERLATTEGQLVDVPYGSACIFWTGLLHYVPVNAEQQTRWSINIRYKNLFSPYGSKGLPEFFRVLDLSPLGKLAFEYEAKGHIPVTV